MPLAFGPDFPASRHALVLAMFMIWSRILKMTLIQQQSLHVRHALSGSGLEGDLRERGNRDGQLSDTLTTMLLTQGFESYMSFFLP